MKAFKPSVTASVAKTADRGAVKVAPGQAQPTQEAPQHSAVATLSASQFDSLPDGAYLRAAQLVQSAKHPNNLAPLPFSAPTLWRKVKDGTFPAPVKLSAGVTAWRLGAIRSWLAAQPQYGGAAE